MTEPLRIVESVVVPAFEGQLSLAHAMVACGTHVLGLGAYLGVVLSVVVWACCDLL